MIIWSNDHLGLVPSVAYSRLSHASPFQAYLIHTSRFGGGQTQQTVAMGCRAAWLLLLAVGCECYTRTLKLGCDCCATPRNAVLSMRKKDAVSRREVVDGSITKQFYDPDGFRANLPVGWSPALVVFLGAAVSAYGGSTREKLFDELRDLSSASVKNLGTSSHVPIVTLVRGRKSAEVSVEITAPRAVSGDAIDFIWASDASTGEVFAGRRFSPNETPTLRLSVDRGRKVVPSVHSVRDGVWDGEAIVATAP